MASQQEVLWRGTGAECVREAFAMKRLAVELWPKRKPSDKHWYAYDVLLGGEIVVANSRDPEHDLARVLLARGVKGQIEVLDGKTGKARSTVHIEAAAKLSVSSNLHRRTWKPLERLAVRAGRARNSCPAPRCSHDLQTPLRPFRSNSIFDEGRSMDTDVAAKWLQQHDPKLNRSRKPHWKALNLDDASGRALTRKQVGDGVSG
jgi:hypothetical protein